MKKMLSVLEKYCQEHTPKEDQEKYRGYIMEKSMDECEKDGLGNW